MCRLIILLQDSTYTTSDTTHLPPDTAPHPTCKNEVILYLSAIWKCRNSTAHHKVILLCVCKESTSCLLRSVMQCVANVTMWPVFVCLVTLCRHQDDRFKASALNLWRKLPSRLWLWLISWSDCSVRIDLELILWCSDKLLLLMIYIYLFPRTHVTCPIAINSSSHQPGGGGKGNVLHPCQDQHSSRPSRGPHKSRVCYERSTCWTVPLVTPRPPPAPTRPAQSGDTRQQGWGREGRVEEEKALTTQTVVHYLVFLFPPSPPGQLVTHLSF